MYAGGETFTDKDRVFNEDEFHGEFDDLMQRGFFVEVLEEVKKKK